ncbi:MFS transporter [Natrialbaceae archaeon AArc-T1-2]|nr:MFS transporter [Natrialbaceae archaeon AArc-T1-2]WIV68654.1 MFS transporter [Natrialbaceae archaeon AArc-T1-2]
MVQFLRYVFPPLFETFQSTYGVTNTQTGLLFTLLLIGYSSMQLPSGVIADRYDKKNVIVIGVALFTAASFSAIFAPTFGFLLLATALIGIGTGVHKTVAVAYLSIVHSKNTGSALGIMDTVGQFGGVVAPILVVLLLDVTGYWQSVFLIGGAVGAALAALFVTYGETEYVHRSADTSSTSSNPQLSDYISSLLNPQLLSFTVVITIFTFLWNGIVSFLPLFLTTQKGFSTELAGIAYSILFIASLVQAVTGTISDNFGSLKLSLGLFTLATISIILLVTVQSWLAIFVAVGLIGIGFHGFRPIRDAYLMELISTDVGGGVLGTVRTVMTVIGGLAPVTVGFLIDLFGYTTSFSFLIVVILVGNAIIGVMLLTAKRT